MRRQTLAASLVVLLALLFTSLPSQRASAADRIAELRQRLRDKDAAVQMQAVQQAADLGPLAAAAVPDLTALLAHPSLAVRHEAAHALGAIGGAAESAVPALTKLLQDDSLILKNSALSSLRQIGPAAKGALPQIEPLLKAADRMVSVPAAAACVAIDPSASPRHAAAIKVLAAALGDERPLVRAEAAQALAQAGPAIVPQLVSVLKQGPDAARIAAAGALEQMDDDAAPAAPALLALASSSNADVLVAIASALGNLQSESAAIVPALARLARNEAPRVRLAAVHALANFGEAGAPQVGLLVELLRDADPLVRQGAAEALGNVGAPAQAAVSALDAALDDKEGAVTIRAAEALSHIGAAALPAVLKRFDDPNYTLLMLETLGRMGPAARNAAPKLVQRLGKAEPDLRRELCLILSAINPDPKVAVPALQQVAQDAKNEARPAAIYALGRIGDKGSLKIITAAVEDAEPRTRLAAAWSLVHIDPENPDYVRIAVPRLTEALERPEARIRLQAARTLGELGSKATSAAPALRKRVAEDAELAVRLAAAAALAEYGADSAAAVPELLLLASEPDPECRRTAYYALGRIGGGAKDAVPVLRKEIQQGPVGERSLAAWALVQIQPEPKLVDEALPALLKALKHERPEAVVQILNALVKVGRGRADVVEGVTALQSSEDPALRAAAESALAKLR